MVRETVEHDRERSAQVSAPQLRIGASEPPRPEASPPPFGKHRCFPPTSSFPPIPDRGSLLHPPRYECPIWLSRTERLTMRAQAARLGLSAFHPTISTPALGLLVIRDDPVRAIGPPLASTQT